MKVPRSEGRSFCARESTSVLNSTIPCRFKRSWSRLPSLDSSLMNCYAFTASLPHFYSTNTCQSFLFFELSMGRLRCFSSNFGINSTTSKCSNSCNSSKFNARISYTSRSESSTSCLIQFQNPFNFLIYHEDNHPNFFLLSLSAQ